MGSIKKTLSENNILPVVVGPVNCQAFRNALQKGRGCLAGVRSKIISQMLDGGGYCNSKGSHFLLRETQVHKKIQETHNYIYDPGGERGSVAVSISMHI